MMMLVQRPLLYWATTVDLLHRLFHSALLEVIAMRFLTTGFDMNTHTSTNYEPLWRLNIPAEAGKQEAPVKWVRQKHCYSFEEKR